jgi:hypothetical protein
MKIELCKYTLYNVGTGGQVGKQVHNLVNEYRLEVRDESVATGNLQSVVHDCGKG